MATFIVDVWLNVSIPPPPYWPEDKPGPNITAKWAASGLSNSMPTRFILRPWIFDDQGTVGHQQMVLVLATGDVDHLIRDSNDSTGWYTKFEFTTVLRHSNTPAPSAGVSSASAAVPTAGIGVDSTVSGGNVRRSRLVERYVQVIGCTLCIEEMQVAITERGFLAEDSTPTHPAPHPWEDFEWQESSEESIERQGVSLGRAYGASSVPANVCERYRR